MLAAEPTKRPTILDVITKLTSLSINIFIRNIKEAGFTVAKFHKAGFELIDIFKGGYTYGEIQSIYKLNPKQYTDLRKLLKHCDKKRDWMMKKHISKECTIDTICIPNQLLEGCADHYINAHIRRSRSSSSNSRSRSRSRSKSRSTIFLGEVADV